MTTLQNRKLFITLSLLVFLQINVCCQVDAPVMLDSQQALVEKQNSVIKLTNTAIHLIKQNKQTEALSNLHKALAIDSTYRPAYLQLYQAGILDVKNCRKIVDGLNKGKSIFKDDDELHFYCAEIYRFKAELDSAIFEYDNAIKYSKANGEDFYLVPYYYFNRGNCYLKKNDLQSALKDYDYLIKLDPFFLAGLTNRGICLFKLGNKEAACSDWKKASEMGYEPAIKYYEKHGKSN